MAEPGNQEFFKSFEIAFLCFLTLYLAGCLPTSEGPEPTLTIPQRQLHDTANIVRATDTSLIREGSVLPLSPIEGYLSEEGLDKITNSIGAVALPEKDKTELYSMAVLPSSNPNYSLIITDFHESKNHNVVLLTAGVNPLTRFDHPIEIPYQDYNANDQTTLFAVLKKSLPLGMDPRGLAPTQNPFTLNRYSHVLYLGSPVISQSTEGNEIEIRFAGEVLSSKNKKLALNRGRLSINRAKLNPGSSGGPLLGLNANDELEVVGSVDKLNLHYSNNKPPTGDFALYGQTLKERMKRLDKTLPKKP